MFIIGDVCLRGEDVAHFEGMVGVMGVGAWSSKGDGRGGEREEGEGGEREV